CCSSEMERPAAAMVRARCCSVLDLLDSWLLPVTLGNGPARCCSQPCPVCSQPSSVCQVVLEIAPAANKARIAVNGSTSPLVARPAGKEDEPSPRTSRRTELGPSLTEIRWNRSPEVGLLEIRSRRGCLGRDNEGSDERPEAAAHHGGPLCCSEMESRGYGGLTERAEIGGWKLGSAAARDFAGEERHDGVWRHWRKSAVLGNLRSELVFAEKRER
ncbi:hypothetical protein STAS_35519, partial [Striga asiatica]